MSHDSEMIVKDEEDTIINNRIAGNIGEEKAVAYCMESECNLNKQNTKLEMSAVLMADTQQSQTQIYATISEMAPKRHHHRRLVCVSIRGGSMDRTQQQCGKQQCWIQLVSNTVGEISYKTTMLEAARM